MWERFLASADADKAYGALDVLNSVDYDIESVDAEKCAQHDADLKAAITAAPVSMAVRRAAFLCADATGDAAAAEREMAILAALSQYALKQSGAEPLLGDPMRVMAPATHSRSSRASA